MFAQSVVTGTVKDASGENLIGVNVIVKGTSTGVSTNVNGEFSIRVSDANATLEFSYVGYQTEEVRLQGRTVLNVVMREDVGQLEEVVVVGYGTQKKEHVTGSVAQVNADDLIKVPTGNLSNALVGKLPGLVSMQKSGQPGSDHANL
ncbi:MAG: carboxypeptidase-like regulatory domain-containing protein, partial [Bacteroidota bacterium]|nr:carboxypeptidase-like regulatory domain-containing protein [Bacteroidota bacterium]